MSDNSKNQQHIPAHIALILDGNRRWAKERNLPSFDGHYQGYKKVKSAPSWFFERGVKVVSVFAFSTENWNRQQDEVNYLMKLLKDTIDEQVAIANEKGYQILISGRLDELPGDLPESCQNAMTATNTNKQGILNVCFNYGGRAEIVDAVKKMIRNGLAEEQIHEGMIKKYFCQQDIPDVDLLVRTSGEYRTSGFLLWQAAYAELIFLQKYWPEFEQTDVDFLLQEYNNRERRFGK